MDLGSLTNDRKPRSRWAQGLDARWKLAAIFVGVAAVLLIGSLPGATCAAIGSGLLVAWARLPGRWLVHRFGASMLFVAFLALPLPFLSERGPTIEWGGLRLSWHGATAGSMILLKSAAIMLLILFLLGTTTIETILKAARSLWVPDLLVQLALLTHRYIFVLADEFGRLRTALRVRGFRNRSDRHSYRTIGHVAGTLLVRGSERAERVVQAMRCRGFDGQFRSLVEFKTAGPDVCFFILLVCGAGALLALDRYPR